MEILVCIDDTDDLAKTTSTGKVAEAIEARLLADAVAHESRGITRHQLLLDERINYTSHNSSMCLALTRRENINELSAAALNEIKSAVIHTGVDRIRELKAAEADPGLCVLLPEQLNAPDALISFGVSGQRVVLTKDQAYALAQKEGLHLSEHGGDGSGVIGALCGVGLRLSGFDGWFRGKLKPAALGLSGKTVSARELTAKTGVPVFCAGARLQAEQQIELQEGLKCMLMNHRKVIAVHRQPGQEAYRPYSKKTVKNSVTLQAAGCSAFETDNDLEERLAENPAEKSCFNCLYRRWTRHGFRCVRV